MRKPPALNDAQIAHFHQHGYLLIEQALPAHQITALSDVFSTWVQESRQYSEPYGTTLDHRPRFDVEPGHCHDAPALRRVTSPIEISPVYYDVMKNSAIADFVAQLLGPNIKFHHSKVNSKLPGSGTTVKFHQDFPYEPHSNDSLITALLFLDTVTEQNGPLEVVPGSHKGPLYGLWHDGVFTGAVTEAQAEWARSQSVRCLGPAGTLCLMHTRLLHGSTANLSPNPRTLFLCTYSAEDAIPLSPNPLPSRYAGEIVRGKSTNRVRCSHYEMELPEVPEGASFFSQQAKMT